MSVQQHELLTDNPFRILSIGSSETFVSVRKKADAAAKAAKVGLLPELPMSELLGAFDLEQLPQLIRGSFIDAKQRTCYRIMWPLSQESIPILSRGTMASCSLLPSEELAQVRFLSSWHAYLDAGGPEDAAEAFERWEELYSTYAMDERLVGLLVAEDDLDPDSAYDVILQAQREVALTILRRVSTDAASSWDAGHSSIAAQLTKVVLNSPIEDDLEELAIEPVCDSANRLVERVEALIQELGEWRIGSSTEPPKEVTRLERISAALRGRLPSATDWDEAARRWTTALVWRMREEGLRLNQRDDNERAINVIQDALTMANSPDQRAKLQNDIRELKEILAQENREAAFADVERVNRIPSLRTINGFGLMLYGRKPFPADPTLYFTILYCTAVYIPVFPVARYLVRDAEGGGWHFIGKTKWTHGMKVYCAFSIILMLDLYSLMAANKGSDENPIVTSDTGGYTSSDPPSADAVQPEKPSSPKIIKHPVKDKKFSFDTSYDNVVTERRANIDYGKWIDERKAKEKKREKLQGELASLKVKLASITRTVTDEGTALDGRRSILDSLRAEIDASKPNPYSKEELDAHNAKVERYEGLRAEFNDAVRSYNRKVNLEKVMVRKHNEIVGLLNADR
jgi:hypothetical protein